MLIGHIKQYNAYWINWINLGFVAARLNSSPKIKEDKKIDKDLLLCKSTSAGMFLRFATCFLFRFFSCWNLQWRKTAGYWEPGLQLQTLRLRGWAVPLQVAWPLMVKISRKKQMITWPNMRKIWKSIDLRSSSYLLISYLSSGGWGNQEGSRSAEACSVSWDLESRYF